MITGCGGVGGSGSSSESNPAPAYNFVADSGVRVAGGIGPVELVVGTTTYMYVGIGGTATVLASTDGLAFTTVQATVDGGPLISGAWFSFVALPSGGYRMYFARLLGSLLSATSTDGLTWTSEPGTRVVLNSIAVPKVVALLGGGYRVYYTTSGGPTGIASETSSDGLNFTADDGLRLSPVPKNHEWGDPNVVVNGSFYLMSATHVPADHVSYSSIWLSSSADGLTWTDPIPIISNPGGSPVDSSFVPLSNGAFRVYHGLFLNAPAGPNTGNAQSEILSGVLTPAS